MQLLKFENITKTYGEKTLLKDVSLAINRGNKIALIAKNGTGKTSLLRILAGDDRAEGEQAKTIYTKGITVGYLEQEPHLSDNHTVLEEVFESQSSAVEAIKEYELALSQQNQIAIEKAIAKIEDHKAWNIEASIKEILSHLKIDKLDQKITSLSGGERKRIALTKILITEPDLFIMDEPTNHLDMEMIEWLEQYFAKSSTTLFVVTHDRYFIEAVCNQIIELEGGQLHTYGGTYSDYVEKKELLEENTKSVHHKTTQRYKQELEWMRRQPKARGTKSKDRIKAFHEVQEVVHSRQSATEMIIDLKESRLGTKIMEAHSISKSFGEKILINKFSYKFQKGDRIGIVGKNGVGKTTFLQILTQNIKPDNGKVVHGETLSFGYYTQKGLVLKEGKRVIDVIRDIAEYIPLEKGKKLTAERMLENFLFSRPQQQLLVSQLSGGERKRLYLLSILMKNPNFLILDEPTNDLDIVTLNVLEEYLLQFKGCVVIVSHDRYFMDRLVNHLFVFEGEGNIKNFQGNYSDYRNHYIPLSKQEKEIEKKSSSGKSDFKRNKKIRSLEATISKMEKRKSEIEQNFLSPALSPKEIEDLARELENLKELLEEKERQWMELMDDSPMM